MASAAAPPTLMVDDDVEMVLEADLEEDQQPQFIYMVINSLAEGGPASLRPPIFREALGPREDVVADVPDVPEDVVPDSPASPDPFGDEGSNSDAESDISMASTIVWYPGHPRSLIDSGMSDDEADEAQSSDDEEDEGRLVIDLDSPRSPSPPPPSDDEEDDEDERSYYLGLYQSSLQQYIGLLLQSPRQP